MIIWWSYLLGISHRCPVKVDASLGEIHDYKPVYSIMWSRVDTHVQLWKEDREPGIAKVRGALTLRVRISATDKCLHQRQYVTRTREFDVSIARPIIIARDTC